MKLHTKIKSSYLQACLMALFVTTAQAQDPIRFRSEVDSLITLHNSSDKSNAILFTGSSSIRLWKDLKSSFPNHNVLNGGFGGSEMADLLYYIDSLILPLRPIQIFIYEGDNDISRGRAEDQIIATADSILKRIQKQLPNTEVIFISPKPSIARWHLKEKYESYNKTFKAWSDQQNNVQYADVWTPMIDENGDVLKDIFIQDNLHLNEKGYKIWTSVLKKYLKAPSH
ncbi:MAG TPA: GDSL-type esterase/lipase family protein [Chryseolinea sp.]|nr:GDSL-type esterase/lipase family protein [Chryseolinea sp.]